MPLELIAISIWLDTASLAGRKGLTGFVGDWGPVILRSLMAFGVIPLTFGYLSARSKIEHISTLLNVTPIAWRFLVVHAGCMLGFALLSAWLFAGRSSDWVAGAWLATGIGGIAFAGFALLPPALWWSLIRATGLVWLVASLAGIAALSIGRLGQSLWYQAAGLTFAVVQGLLRPFLSPVISDPATRTLGSPRFGVIIDPTCSGLEGVGMILVFMAAWLWFFRREYRFPHALVVIPVGVCLMWLLNSVRIAALILIGHAGAPGIAMGGFHSQAGWIAFNAAALGFMLAIRRTSWLAAREPSLSDRVTSDGVMRNPTAFYLGPFLAILAAAMLSRTISNGFEWLYPLRFFAAAAVLWLYRRQYSSLDWNLGWLAPVIGGVVFVLWLASDWASGIRHSENAIASGLAHLPLAGRIGWLVLRVMAAVVTVPIAEELAFRGFLIRRLISADFESVNSKAFTYLGVLVSSAAFGVLHGDRWLAGTMAGALYAFAFLRHGRLGDAIAAHATTNGLLAAWVLLGDRWYYW